MGHPTPPRGLRPADPDQGSLATPSQLIESVRGHGGTLAHVLGALGTFRLRHGHWPGRLYLYPETLAALVQDLTPLGFYRLQQHLDVLTDLERDLFCADDSGNVSIYRVQAVPDAVSIDVAAAWLGLAGSANRSPTHGHGGVVGAPTTPKPPR
ncbi:hypothetical protein PMO31116_01242 [Pandoraea morbifera]|uniref:Uncharacterized protein n=1 Tax=Pandoraea morbifera TaxID=2508300 RepID=A0A5E4TAU8_9BURK|nr:hypothetical protein [Pandoraea morbifera]VVD84073.1 hypothetical protein PMO31116_01242 [Pandoraea morbifera]